MAWPASSQTHAVRLAEIDSYMLRARNAAQDVRDRSALGSIKRGDLITLMQRLYTLHMRLQEAVDMNESERLAFIAYANAQKGDGASWGAQTEFTAVRNAAAALRQWIYDNFPRDSGGAILTTTIDATGAETALMFTPAQLAGFRTQADLFLATIT